MSATTKNWHVQDYRLTDPRVYGTLAKSELLARVNAAIPRTLVDSDSEVTRLALRYAFYKPLAAADDEFLNSTLQASPDQRSYQVLFDGLSLAASHWCADPYETADFRWVFALPLTSIGAQPYPKTWDPTRLGRNDPALNALLAELQSRCPLAHMKEVSILPRLVCPDAMRELAISELPGIAKAVAEDDTNALSHYALAHHPLTFHANPVQSRLLLISARSDSMLPLLGPQQSELLQQACMSWARKVTDRADASTFAVAPQPLLQCLHGHSRLSRNWNEIVWLSLLSQEQVRSPLWTVEMVASDQTAHLTFTRGSANATWTVSAASNWTHELASLSKCLPRGSEFVRAQLGLPRKLRAD